MPYITTKGSSTVSGTGFSFFDLPGAEDLTEPEIKLWFSPSGEDNSWEQQENWFTDAECTEQALGLPGFYTDVVLLSDAVVHIDSTSGAAYTTTLGKSVDVNNNTLYIIGHAVVENPAWALLSEQEQNDYYDGIGTVEPYSCASADQVDISMVVNNAVDVPEFDEFGEYYTICLSAGHVQAISV